MTSRRRVVRGVRIGVSLESGPSHLGVFGAFLPCVCRGGCVCVALLRGLVLQPSVAAE
jgi:hypothetical protein